MEGNRHDDDATTITEEEEEVELPPLTTSQRLEVARGYFPAQRVSNEYPGVEVDSAFLMNVLVYEIDDYDAMRAVKAELAMPSRWNGCTVERNVELGFRVWMTVANCTIPNIAIRNHPQLSNGRTFRFNYTQTDCKHSMAPFCVVSALGGPREFVNHAGNFPQGMLSQVAWLTENEKEVVGIAMLQNMVKYGDVDGCLNKKMGWKKLYDEKNLGSWLHNQETKVETNGVISYNWLAARCFRGHADYTEDIHTLKQEVDQSCSL